jgi:hypothetical protein
MHANATCGGACLGLVVRVLVDDDDSVSAKAQLAQWVVLGLPRALPALPVPAFFTSFPTLFSFQSDLKNNLLQWF